MKPIDFLIFARALVMRAGGEADGTPGRTAELRSAVSRAYYAAFNQAAELLRVVVNCTIPGRPESHRLVYRLLRRSGVHTWSMAAGYLATLRENRNEADYELAVDTIWTRESAEAALGLADEVFAILTEFLDEPRRISADMAERLRTESRRMALQSEMAAE